MEHSILRKYVPPPPPPPVPPVDRVIINLTPEEFHDLMVMVDCYRLGDESNYSRTGRRTKSGAVTNDIIGTCMSLKAIAKEAGL